jgi:hypothetical protein
VRAHTHTRARARARTHRARSVLQGLRDDLWGTLWRFHQDLAYATLGWAFVLPFGAAVLYCACLGLLRRMLARLAARSD